MRTVDPVRHAARRAAILGAAAGVFAQRGFDGASTAAICRAAGIGSGTLFHYFPDKRSIFVAIFAEDLQRTSQLLAGLDHTSWRQDVDVVVAHRIRDADDPAVPGLLAALITQAGRDPELAAVIGEEDALARDTLAALVAAGQRAGEVDPDLDPGVVAVWICSLTDALYFQAAEGDTTYPVRRAMLFTLLDHLLAAP